MILLPHPELEESTRALPVDLLFAMGGSSIHLWLCGGGSGYNDSWKYHNYALATYGLLCVKRALSLKGLPAYAQWVRPIHTREKLLKAKDFYTRILTTTPDTKLPEWVGNPGIHIEHQQIMKEGFPWSEPQVVPEINLKERLASIQPYIKAYFNVT